MTSKTSQRVAALEALLSEPVVDVDALRAFSHGGVPDESKKRAVVWRLLLDCLPPQREAWQSSADVNRDCYRQFLEELVIDSHELEESSEKDGGAEDDDDPLGCLSSASNKPSKWDTFFEENKVLNQIDLDVKRLTPEFAFYQMPTGRPRPIRAPLHLRIQKFADSTETHVTDRAGVRRKKVSVSEELSRQESARSSFGDVAESPPPLPSDGTDKAGDDPNAEAEASSQGTGTRTSSSTSTSTPGVVAAPIPSSMRECHWEVIERILFVYAKLNPGVSYVQGMNEILGPLYYVLASDKDKVWSVHAEADAFFCFSALMSELREMFMKNLDNTHIGITAILKRLQKLMRDFKPALARNLEEKGINPQFYAFRWITLMFSQEFSLPDVVRLWDSLFSSSDRVTYLVYLCGAMLTNVASTLEDGDFATIVKTLQNYPPTDIHAIIRGADAFVDFVAHKKRHEKYLRNGDVR